MANKIRQLIKEGKPAFGAQLRFGSPGIAELFSHAGFDWLSIDSEHAPQTPVGIQAQLQAIACGSAMGVVRVPKNDPDLIRLYLDMGALGVVIPFIETAEQAKAAVAACRYPPRGIRGFGPARAYRYGLDARYLEEADEKIIVMPIIESALAVKNIDAIFAVDGIETCLLGPADLAISLGVGLNIEHAKVQEAIQKFSAAGRAAGKVPGGAIYGDFMDPAATKRQLDAGFKVLFVGGDEWMLSGGCKRLMQGLREFRS